MSLFDEEEIQQLQSTIQRVRELHKENWSNTDKAFEDTTQCEYCGTLYPCPTIRALDGEQ